MSNQSQSDIKVQSVEFIDNRNSARVVIDCFTARYRVHIKADDSAVRIGRWYCQRAWCRATAVPEHLRQALVAAARAAASKAAAARWSG